MIKWGYLMLLDISLEELNELGDLGWELVTITNTKISHMPVFYLKREKL